MLFLGMGDATVAAALWANLIAVAVCVGYGLYNWNRGKKE